MKIQKIRYEPFGGIIGTRDPAGLYWVDREFLRGRGFEGGPVWEDGAADSHLSRPAEMEITVTTRCNLQCPCCYAGSGPGGRDVPFSRVAAALGAAARMDVFHVAFGGGEPLLHPRLLDMARLARDLNLLPALTTNGLLVDRSWARKARRLFARVNVSVDVGGAARDRRAELDGSLAAVSLLSEAGVPSGVNYIATREGLCHLPRVFERSAAAGADSILALRPKPSGRGGELYSHLHPTRGQQEELIPLLRQLSRRFDLPFHLDCAWAPLLLASGLDPCAVGLLGGRGCIAGELLITVDEEGRVHPCSHLPHTGGPVETIADRWGEEKGPFPGFPRGRCPDSGPCARCPCADLCRGGCPSVNLHRGVALNQPDPDLACGRGD